MSDQRSNSPRNSSTDAVTFIDTLRRAVEALEPDLRGSINLRPELPGEVLAVHDDPANTENYYTVDVVIKGAGKSGSDLSLPEVPVDSIWAENGYGVFAIPEVGSEVTIAFDNFDIRRPRVTASRYKSGQAPAGLGFKAGAFVIQGKHGQVIKLSADVNEIVMSAASVKMITTDKRQEHVEGDHIRRVRGKRKTQVDGAENLSVDSWNVTVNAGAFIQCASLVQSAQGDMTQSAGGSLSQSAGGSYSQSAAGGASASTAFNKREIVGGSYEILVAATPGIAPTPTPGPTAPQFAAYKVIVNLGGIAFDCIGGQIDIGSNPVLPPTMINIGGPASGPINLGGIGAVGQPLPNGVSLFAFITMLLEVLKTVPLQIGNLGVPTMPSPALVAAIQAIQSSMLGADPLTSPLMCKRVFASLV
jgi:hypothetical protein